jgi:hypothetical protein
MLFLGLCAHSEDQFPISFPVLQISKRLERTAGDFKRLGQLGFWGQLVCSVTAAVILAFSVLVTGHARAPVSTYLTAGGIAAAFLSTFWSFGYTRLSQKLRDAVNDPAKVTLYHNDNLFYLNYAELCLCSNGVLCCREQAPPRAEVVKRLKDGIVINCGCPGCESSHFLQYSVFTRSAPRLQSGSCSRRLSCTGEKAYNNSFVHVR